MTITAKMVKELRAMTGAGMMDCKKALTETGGDVESAVDVLREKGLAKAAKKADRIAAMGLTGTAFAADGSSAAIVEVNSETDFVAKNAEFQRFVMEMAKLALNESAYSMEGFMALPYEGATVQDALNALISKIGENISIRRFAKMAKPGVVYTGYSHGGGLIGVIVGLETSATAEECAVVGKDVAMQVASMNPKYLCEDEVEQSYIDHEKEVMAQLLANDQKNKGKPEAVLEKILENKLKKEIKEICLTDQKFVKDSSMTVSQYVAETAKKVGKDMKIDSSVRYEVGEGIQKKEDDFAAEVAAAVSAK